MKDYHKFYDELNAQQRSAVDTIEGPVLVLAGPGTGKTQLLSVRAASILAKKKIRPENILILTYTNSAAKAMKERLAKIIGLAGYDIEVGTFHSFANSIIQESEEAANYVGDKIAMNDVERMKVMEYMLDNTKGVEEIRPFRAPYTYIREILQKIGELKKDGITPDELDSYLADKKSFYHSLEEKYIKRLKALAIAYRMYEKLKEGKTKGIFDDRGRYDFEDMIIYATKALKDEKLLRDEYRDQYKYVMVDEYQDTNESQLELLFTLLDYDDPNILCVGDDDQSIYRFQGASVGNFKLLEKRFPHIKIISLKNNYRSTKELIDVSSRIISLIPPQERMEGKSLEAVKKYSNKEIIFKEFTTEEEELIYIVDKVKELKDRTEREGSLSEEERAHPYNNMAILVRKRNDILKIIDAFLKAGIPYATDGKEDIGGEKRVAQLLDVLELAHTDPKGYELKDLALYKVLSSDYLRIPQVDILRFISYVNKENLKDKDGWSTILEEFLRYFSSKRNDIKFEKPQSLYHFHTVIKRLLDDAPLRPVHAVLTDYIKDAGLFKFLLEEYSDNGILRIRQLRALSSFVNMVKAADMANPGIRLTDFMSELKTRKDHDLPIQGNLVTLTQTGVRIYTAHGSKGLEFHSVIIPFCLQNKNWPIRPIPDKIRLPFDLFKTKEAFKEKEHLKELVLQDETRLFYVAMTRAKSSLIFTASPTEDSISTFYLNGLDIEKERPEYVDEEKLIEKSLETTDLADPFVGTEEVLRDIVADISLNPTKLNNYITCKRKFLYNDVLKLPGTKKKSLVFGNCVHKALEDTYKKYMDTKKFPPFQFFEDAFRKELRFQGVDRSMERDCLGKMKTLRGWFDMISKKPVMPIDLEKKLLVTIGDNIIFTGKYDKVEWVDEGKALVRIVDYKTGKPDEHLKKIDEESDLASADCDGYLRQLISYKLLFEKDKKESKARKVRCGVLVFIEPLSADLRRKGYKKGDYVTKTVEIRETMVQELEGIVKSTWDDIRKLRFEKLAMRDNKVCGHCDFNIICWG